MTQRMWQDIQQQYGEAPNSTEDTPPPTFSPAQWANELRLQRLTEIVEMIRLHLENLCTPIEDADIEGASAELNYLHTLLQKEPRAINGLWRSSSESETSED
jgi:hypothetical protein